jgi:hypothetical protein
LHSQTFAGALFVLVEQPTKLLRGLLGHIDHRLGNYDLRVFKSKTSLCFGRRFSSQSAIGNLQFAMK